MSIEKGKRNEWIVKNGDGGGGAARIEPSRVKGRPGWVAIRNEGIYTWISPEDLEDFIAAIRDAANPNCEHCNGSGKKNP